MNHQVWREICQRLKSALIVITGHQVEDTSPSIDAKPATDIIVITAQVLIRVNDAHIAIRKNENTMLRFDADELN